MYEIISLSDYEGTQIEKSFSEGKVPVRKTVTRKGKTFTQTYWVKQKDLDAFKSTEKAVEFLTGTVEAYAHFSNMLADLSKYNDKLGAEVYSKMKEAGQSVIDLAGKTVKVSDWSGRRQTELSDLLAGIQIHMKSTGKDSVNFGEIEKLYGEISYHYDHSGLSVTTSEGEKKISVVKEMNPENWGGKVANIAKAIKDSITRSLGKVQEIFEKRIGNQATTEAPAKEATKGKEEATKAPAKEATTGKEDKAHEAVKQKLLKKYDGVYEDEDEKVFWIKKTAKVKKDGETEEVSLTGIANLDGKVIVPPKYNSDMGIYEDAGKKYFITATPDEESEACYDESGKEIIPPGEYSYIHEPKNGRIVANKNKKTALLDTEGKVIVPADKYTMLSAMKDYDGYSVQKDGKWGVIDKDDKVIVPIKYENESDLTAELKGNKPKVPEFKSKKLKEKEEQIKGR